MQDTTFSLLALIEHIEITKPQFCGEFEGIDIITCKKLQGAQRSVCGEMIGVLDILHDRLTAVYEDRIFAKISKSWVRE